MDSGCGIKALFSFFLMAGFLVGCAQPLTIPPPVTPTPSVAAPSPSATPSPSASSLLSWTSSPVLANLRHLRLFGREAGWVITDQAIYRFQDGGLEEVTPPNLGEAGYTLTFYFLDIQHAWLLHPAEMPVQGTLYHTADGGKNWESLPVPFGMADLVFLNASQGWAMASLGAGAGSSSIAIYQTTDAGHSWELRFVNDPSIQGAREDIPLGGMKNGLAARDMQTAWVAGTIYAPLTPYLYVTHDGGQSWRPQNLPLPTAEADAQLSFHPPIFLGDQFAILTAEAIGQRMHTAIYTSRDGGDSWELVPTLLDGIGHFQAFSPKEWLFWNGTAFFSTSDGGQTWETRAPNQDFGDAFAGMQFLSPQEGFLWTISAEARTSLYHTLDGGSTWTLLNP